MLFCMASYTYWLPHNLLNPASTLTALRSFDPKIRAQMFIVGNMNIQNPLDPGENLVHNKLSSRRASRFSQVIQAGAKNLQPVLSHLDKELERDQGGGGNGGFSTSVALFDNFFSNSWSR